MSEDIGDISPAQALAEIETIRRDFPFATEKYTPEIDARKRALYVRAYDEPEEQAPKGRQFPEIIKQRKEVKPRETARRRAVVDADDDDNGGLGTFPRRGYVEAWGNHEPTAYDVRQWDKAVRTAAKIGVSPTQLGKLRDALLEDAPVTDDDDGGAYSVDAYPPPFSIPDENSWRIFKAAREIASRHNISPAAFSELSTLVIAANEVIGEPQMRRAQRAAVFDLIHNVGEDRAVGVVKAAQRALEHFRPSGPELDRLLSTPVSGALVLGDHPIMIELLGNVGQAIAYDALPREFKSISGNHAAPRDRGNPMAQQSDLDEIKALKAERLYHAVNSKEYREMSARLTTLFERAYPGNQGDDDDSRNGLGSLNRFNERR